jgi:PH domain
VRFCF